jgi:hypothetical protein
MSARSANSKDELLWSREPSNLRLRDRVAELARRVCQARQELEAETQETRRFSVEASTETARLRARQRVVNRTTARLEYAYEKTVFHIQSQRVKLAALRRNQANGLSRDETYHQSSPIKVDPNVAHTAWSRVRNASVALTPRTRDTVRQQERDNTHNLILERNNRFRKVKQCESEERDKDRSKALLRKKTQDEQRSRRQLDDQMKKLETQLALLDGAAKDNNQKRNEIVRSASEQLTAEESATRRAVSRSKDRAERLRSSQEQAHQIREAILALKSEDQFIRASRAQLRLDYVEQVNVSRSQVARQVVEERSRERLEKLESKVTSILVFTPGRRSPISVCSQDESDEAESMARFAL